MTLQLAAMYLPLLQDFLSLTSLPLGEVALIFGISVLVLPILEIRKYLQRTQFLNFKPLFQKE